jgi:hypothetical protein
LLNYFEIMESLMMTVLYANGRNIL